MSDQPLLRVSGVSKFYGNRVGCQDVSFELWPGEVLAVVGESGPGGVTNCVRSLALSSATRVRATAASSPRWPRVDGSGPPVRRVSDVTTSPPVCSGGSTPGRI